MVRRCIRTNATALYGFDMDALAPLAANVGPLVDEIAVPIAADAYPTQSTSNALDTTQVLRAW